MEMADQLGYKLSIILPVYNEKDYFPIIMEKLLAKDFGSIKKEIIIIESNSSDGTKDIVKKYETREGVKIVYEDKPQGKGHAVRNGFKFATGNIILIQDADLEYNIDDYDVLLRPIIEGQEEFILGSRYSETNRWRIRDFESNRFMSLVMNIGHQCFTTLFNILYGQRLKDPMTMYKVFRKECINDITFECNRFDLDWEIVGRLVRKGYSPLEIPIRYKSRSFSEGKKIKIFRDSLTAIVAIFKYRFCR